MPIYLIYVPGVHYMSPVPVAGVGQLPPPLDQQDTGVADVSLSEIDRYVLIVREKGV